jgi:hypothetical protein
MEITERILYTKLVFLYYNFFNYIFMQSNKNLNIFFLQIETYLHYTYIYIYTYIL